MSHSAQHSLSDAEYTTVSDTVTEYDGTGDTIYLPADEVTWNSQLSIVGPLTIIGDDTTTTKITSGYTAGNPSATWDTDNYFIVIAPTSNVKIELRHLSFNMDSICGGIMITNTTSLSIDSVRIDSCLIKNAYSSGGTMRGVMVQGNINSILDHCTFIDCKKCLDVYGNNLTSWNNYTFSLGNGKGFYYESNVFYVYDTPHSGGAGGIYVARYNTYIFTGSITLSPWFDLHGDQGVGSNNAGMGAEIYNNEITFLDNTRGCLISDQRGGRCAIYKNNVITNGSVSQNIRDEYDDDDNPTESTQPQHVDSSYYWNNRRNNTNLITPTVTENCCGDVAMNAQAWAYDASFDGTSGVGCGASGAMPGTSTDGVGYVVTAHDCDTIYSDDIDDSLYVSEGANNFVLRYVPIEFPHPKTVASAPTSSTTANAVFSGEPR